MKFKEKHFNMLNKNALRKSVLALLLICFSLSSFAQTTNTISGLVKDLSGEPLIGVSVKLGNGKVGTITDPQGKFSLVVPTQSSLTFSYIGYLPQTILANQSFMNVVLKEDNKNLDEVVVVGYGTVKKRDLTGAIASVKSDDIISSPTGNAMEAIQGKVAGMDIVKTSGQAGASVNMLLRGTRSIYGDNSPLFIIDGIAGSFDNLNTYDIESMEILKDASSTAIYGSAGANGVVIITTKRGKESKTTVNFDAYAGVSGFAQYPSAMIGDEYVNLKKEAYRGANGNYPEFMTSIFTDPAVYSAYQDNKWIDFVGQLLDKQTTNQTYNLSVSGGTEKTKIFASYRYYDENGLLEGDNIKRHTFRINVDQAINSWIKSGINVQIGYLNQARRNQGVFGNILTFVPLGDSYDANGNINPIYVSTTQNPLSDEIPAQYRDDVRTTSVNSNAFVEMNPIKGLTYKSVFGANLSIARNGKFFGPQSIANVTATYARPVSSLEYDGSYGYKWDNILTYHTKINKDHDLTLTGISSWSFNQDEMFYAIGQGQTLSSQYYWNLLAGTVKQGISSTFQQSQSMSYAGRVNYSYKGKYLFNASLRADGASRLADGYRWDAFPSAAIAWRMSDENFMKSTQNWLSNLKLRVSYGISGSAGGIAPYSTVANAYTYPQPTAFGNTAGSSIQYAGAYPNASLGWEKSYNTNLGLDMSFLNGRIDATLDLYNTDTKGLLFQRQIPITNGVSAWASPLSGWQNIGQTNNKGIELVVNSRNIVHRNFTWSSAFTFSMNKDKVVYLPDGKDIIGSNLFMGESVRALYDYKYLGIWQQSEVTNAALYGCVPGDIKIATVPITTNGVSDNGVHKYSATDRMYLGSTNPLWFAGLQNNFTYRNFDLSIFFQIRYGLIQNNALITRFNPILNTNSSPSGANYWTPENTDAYYPRPGIHSSTTQYLGWSSLGIVDGSYLKIRNLTLGYTLPEKVLQAMKIQKIRFYATAYNPMVFAFSKMLEGQDPERSGSDNFPFSREFVFGLNVTF